MTDAALRHLQRLAFSGSVEDQARALTARLRAGALTRERVEMAAYVGDIGARAALGPKVLRWTTGRVCCCGGDERDSEHGGAGVDYYTHNFTHACDYYGSPCDCKVEEHVSASPREWDGDKSLSALARGIERRGGAALRVRALVAVARVAVPAFMRGPARLARPRQVVRDALDRAVAVAETWLACPCADHAMAANAPAENADSLGDGSLSAWAAARIASGDRPRVPSCHDRAAIGFCRDADLIGEPAVRSAIQVSLASWALGAP